MKHWTSYEVTPNGRRGELAVSQNNPSVVYLLVANEGGGVEGVYKSINSGASFTKVNNNSGHTTWYARILHRRKGTCNRSGLL